MVPFVGPARADVYWGAGELPGRIAGRTRQQGRFVMLLPRELDMVAAGRGMPLPQPKPPIPEKPVASKAGERKAARHAGDANTAQQIRRAPQSASPAYLRQIRRAPQSASPAYLRPTGLHP